MGASASRKVHDMMAKSQVHPLVEKLAAGLAIYSQSFLGDFWCSTDFLEIKSIHSPREISHHDLLYCGRVVYKNTHIVVSCFLAHREHYFSPSERYWVLMVSAFFAFGSNALMSWFSKQAYCQTMWNSPVATSKMQYNISYANATSYQEKGSIALQWQTECLKDKSNQPTLEFTIGFTVISSIMQMVYDQYGQMMVTCSCVQKCPVCIKCIAEGLGKIAFGILFVGAVLFVLGSIYFFEQMGGDYLVSLITFFITRITNFLVVTSVVVFVTFTMARRAQMKPPPEVLATEKGRKKWEEAPQSRLAKCSACLKCGKPKAQSDMWNKHIGAGNKHQIVRK